jgi:hypothetical protein
MDAAEGGDILWTGRLSGVLWELRLLKVTEGLRANPPCCEDEEPPGPPFISWHLELRSEAGACLRLDWDPERRILSGDPLHGWGMNAIGMLKRRLIRAADPSGRPR